MHYLQIVNRYKNPLNIQELNGKGIVRFIFVESK